MSETHKIKIKKGYSDGSLKVSPKHARARNKDFVSWRITADDDEVTSIENIIIKEGSTNIFLIPPHPDGGRWSAEIRDGLPEDSVCEYSIAWNGKWGPQEHDPKITVNPSFAPSPQKLLAAVVAIIVAFFSWQLFRRKMNRK